MPGLRIRRAKVKSIFLNSILQTVVLIAMVRTAQAYNYNTCSGNNIRWSNGWTNIAISTTSFPPGSPWDVDIQDAMWHWNNVKGSGFNYYYLRGTSGTHRFGNGVNEMYFDGSEASGDTLAVTHISSHCHWFFGWNYGIDETDIAFNTNAGWNTGEFDYANLKSPYNFEQVAEHELGHALGLNHEDRWMALMNSYYANSGPLGYFKEHDPNADDRSGARFLYPDGTSEID